MLAVLQISALKEGRAAKGRVAARPCFNKAIFCFLYRIICIIKGIKGNNKK